MRKMASLCLALLCTSISFAQTNFLPGYIINKSGDTLQTSIDFRQWDINPTVILCKTGTTENRYTVKDIRGFGVNNESTYKTATVSYQLSGLDAVKSGQFYNEEIHTDTVFLRLLVAGKYSLYELTTALRPYYFSETADAGTKELISRSKMGEGNQVIEDLQYKDLLLAYAMRENKRNELLTPVTNMHYNADNLIRVYKKLNGNTAIDFAASEKKRKVNTIELGGGLIGNLISFSSDIDPAVSGSLISGASFENSVSPMVSLGLMLGSSRNFSRMQVGIQLEYMTLSIKGHAEKPADYWVSEDYAATLKTLRAFFQFRYIFKPLQTAKFYILPQAGVANILGNKSGYTTATSTYGTQTPRPDYPQFDGFYALYGIGTGVLYKKHKLELKLNGTTPIYANKHSKTSMSLTQVTLSYAYSLLTF